MQKSEKNIILIATSLQVSSCFRKKTRVIVERAAYLENGIPHAYTNVEF